MQRVLIVSNRLPVSIEKKKGSFHIRKSVGGLATGLGSVYKSYNSMWIGWPGITLDSMAGEENDIGAQLFHEFQCKPVFLSQNDIEKYYDGFSNKTLWPISHYFPQYVVHEETFWESYKRVNELFYDTVSEVIKDDDIIWIHDYHLMLLPNLLRERFPHMAIGFFYHIPFPSYEMFRILPQRKEILKGVLGADLIGFHTFDYVRHFLLSVHRIIGHEYSMGQINTSERTIRVDAFPMGIDYERFAKAPCDPEVKKESLKLQKKLHQRKVILSIDRLDYTKGIPERLQAFTTFLKRNPQYKEKINFVLVAVPSRTQVEQYRLIKKQIDELIGKINGEHGTIGWIPVWYLYRFLSFPVLAALYSIADVAFVTPLRDGMNLVAKEYLATKENGKGVLILSEMAGAAQELGEAIIVNPFNGEEVSNALDLALAMSEEEQRERIQAMQKRIKRYDVVRWTQEFIERLLDTKRLQRERKAKILTPEMRESLVKTYQKAKRRLLLLDYDGTLVPFFPRPAFAEPGANLLRLLKSLAENPKNQVILISGRDKDTLEKWFGNLDICFVAEHGVWLKEEKWEMIEPLNNTWKEQISPILEAYVDRTPGSFIEEKEFSLVWHYRKVDSELSLIRAGELIDELINFTTHLDLHVLEGNKVVEVKNRGINKGRAALRWITKEDWDFILSVGDDWTDEDVFHVLPEKSFSIKVGLRPSLAKFNLESSGGVLLLLEELSLGR